MAGGKETPRQKMIGMMYLVLTALLALNVSKSILDAFVAIEENMQTSNLNELYRGDEKKSEVMEVSTDKSNQQRAAKAKLLFQAIEQIDKMTASRINSIDELKMKILSEIGEDVQSIGQSNSIIVDLMKNNEVQPIRMNLEFVNSKDNYDVPMRVVLGVETDIKKPLGKGLELWKSLNDYRIELIKKIAESQVEFDAVNKAQYATQYVFQPKHHNEFKNYDELKVLIKKDIDAGKVHEDDVETIIEVYSLLSKKEFSTVHGVENVHWLGKTFDHSPSVAAIASLTSMQNDILAARSQAIALIRSRVTGGEYSFNKVMPLAYGPIVANTGDEIELKVMMAAFDSEKQPRVTINDNENANVSVKDGLGTIKLKAGGSTMSLSGTVSVQKKNGQWKEEKWAHEVIIMKPSGSIELPEMNVLYRGYENKVQATASGFDKTSLSGSGLSIVRNGDGWTVKPNGRSRTASLQVVGINSATGERKVLKTINFAVRNLPQPELFWGGVNENGHPSLSSSNLFAKFRPEVTLNAKFKVISWQCSVGNAPGRAPRGTGNSFASAMPLIRQAPRGTTVSFRTMVRYPDGTTGRVNAVFKL